VAGVPPELDADLERRLKKLTAKERTFVWILAMEGNASRARLRAGYADQGTPAKNAWAAWKLKQKPHIAEVLDDVRQAHLSTMQVDAHRIFQELSYIAFADLTDLVDEDGHLLRGDPRQLPPEVRRSIREIVQDVRYTRTTKETDEAGEEVRVEVEVVRTKVKLEPKTPAIKMLGQGLLQALTDIAKPPENTVEDPDDMEEHELVAVAQRGR
jgi:phage terminase small subunit